MVVENIHSTNMYNESCCLMLWLPDITNIVELDDCKNLQWKQKPTPFVLFFTTFPLCWKRFAPWISYFRSKTVFRRKKSSRYLRIKNTPKGSHFSLFFPHTKWAYTHSGSIGRPYPIRKIFQKLIGAPLDHQKWHFGNFGKIMIYVKLNTLIKKLSYTYKLL